MEGIMKSNISFKAEVEKYSSIFNNSHTPMLVINSENGHIVDGNLAASKYYGYEPEELKKLNIGDINILSKQEISERMGQAKIEGGGYFQFKHRLASGEVRDVEVYSGPIIVMGQSYLLSIVHDVQYKKEMEQKILIQESYFKSLFENSPEAVAILDCEFRIINVNESFERIFQYKIDEIKYQNVTEILCDEKMYDESTYLKDCIHKGAFVRTEIQRRRKDGKLVDISFLGYPVMFNGEQIGVYAIYTDLTKVKEERRSQDRKIQMYITLLRSTIDSIPNVLSVYKPDLKLALLNEAGYKYFNIEDKNIEGLNWCDILKSKLPSVDCYGMKVIDTLKVLSFEQWVSDTNQYLEWHCSPIFDEDGELVLIVERIKDITENKRREEELRNAKTKAEEANRFKTQFVANVAHEIRTPMNGIVGIIDLMDVNQLSNEHKDYFQLLRYSADRLSAIVNDVMDFAKIEAGKIEIRNERFHFAKLIEDVGKYFSVQAKNKSLRFELNIDSGIPNALIGDVDKLNQILFNLLSNAIKFTDQGFIKLEIHGLEKATDAITVKFSVRDTGIGIPKEKLSCIFDDYVQIDSASTRKYGGTGLGLAISKKLVEHMGGSIAVESAFGIGSDFFFVLKFNIVEDQNCQKNNSEAYGKMDEFSILAGKNVLIIEDESVNQKILSELLKKSQCRVVLAANGVKALEQLNKQRFDLIMMDIFMPEMDGLELARIIRRNEKSTGGYTPIIATTAAVMNDERVQYSTVGIDECLPKPFEKENLYATIIKILINSRKKDYSLKPLLEFLDGNQKVLEDIIDEVVSDRYQKEFIGKIEWFINNGDKDGLMKQLHKLKGSLSHFQLDSINNLLVQLKEHGGSLDFESCKLVLAELKNEYLSLREFLFAYNKKIKD